MRRLLSLALLATQACLPSEEEDAPDAALGSDASASCPECSETDGGAPEPVIPPVPSTNPDCAPDAVRLTARLADPGPYSRAEAAVITYEVTPAGAYRMFGSGPSGGEIADAGPGRVEFRAAGGEGSPHGVRVPLWQGPYPVELAAQSDEGCVGKATVEVPLVGDVIVGDDGGHLHLRGSDGRPVAELGQALEQPMSALILDPDDPQGLIAGFRSGLGGGPFIARLDARGNIRKRFAEVDLQGGPLFPDGGPRHLYHDRDSDEILCDGVSDGTILRFDRFGDFVGRWRVPAENDYASIGFTRQEGRVIAGHASHDRLYFLGDTPELYLDTGGSFHELYAMAPAYDDEVMVIHSLGDYANQISLFGPGGQEMRNQEIGAAQPEHVVPFRGGYLAVGAYEPIVRYDRDLTPHDPAATGEPWNAGGTLGFSRATSLVWLNPGAEP